MFLINFVAAATLQKIGLSSAFAKWHKIVIYRLLQIHRNVEISRETVGTMRGYTSHRQDLFGESSEMYMENVVHGV